MSPLRRALLLSSLSVTLGAKPAPHPLHPLHPLDPLSKEEITLAVDVLKGSGRISSQSLFPLIALNEPKKAEVLAFKPGATFRREALLVVFDRDKGLTSEAVIDLSARSLASYKELPGVQPPIALEELDQVPHIVRADPAWQQAMRKRGITAFEDVLIDPWAPGVLDPSESPKIRWVRALSYLRGASHNGYARPIEGVVATLDMNKRKVERVIDLGLHPIPPESADLDEKAIGRQREPPRPLQIVQPKGASFKVQDGEVHWQKWRFRFSVHPREGLVLHLVGYEDRGRVRPILYRAALAEMAVPYGDTAANWTFRSAFDEGEYGIGRLTDSLALGTDVPRHSSLFDAVFADDFGKPKLTPRAVAIYERDGGLLWKHFEYYGAHSDSRRSRELVLFSIVTVGNYDYGFSWIFRQDGSLELEAIATGIMLAKGVDAVRIEPGQEGHDAHAHLVAPNVAAPHHQHFFNFRLDFDVDGPEPNQVTELNVRTLPIGPQNPVGNGFALDERVLETEKAGVRDLNFATARRWIVQNPSSKNELGGPSGYALVTGENTIPFQSPEAKVRKRAGFINHHLWVTPYAPEELHAAGEYPNQSEADEGLSKWTRADRSIAKTDIVVWYTFGLTHLPRPEDWPVMPSATIGFKLLPVGFFAKNPALDVPAPR